MSLASAVQTAYETLDTTTDTLIAKSQELLDATTDMSTADNTILIAVRDRMTGLTTEVQAMIDKIQARLDA